jgi:hypothetical protein
MVSVKASSIESVGDPGRLWSVPDDGLPNSHIMNFLDTFPGEPGSQLMPNSAWSRYNDENPSCASLKDEKCSSGGVSFQAVIPHCKKSSDLNCVESLGVITSPGTKENATFTRYFPEKAQNQFEGDLLSKLPSGGPGAIFNLPIAKHAGGSDYYLSVVMNGWMNRSNELNLTDFSVQLAPIVLENVSHLCPPNNCNDTGWGLVKAGDGGNPTGRDSWIRQGPGFSGKNFCVATSAKEGLCAQRYAFPSEVKFFVKVKTQLKPSGWLHGRISEPEINIKSQSDFSEIEIQGYPVAVPAVYKMYRYSEMPQVLKDQYDVATGGYKKDRDFLRNPSNWIQGGRTAESPNPLLRNSIYAPAPFSQSGMDQLKLWLPYVEDKATALISYWSVRTLSASEMIGSSACFTDKQNVTGIVTTNATQYSAGPPQLDKAEGTLNYVVAAPHYGSSGSVFKGSYDLVMRSDVARCVYGFSRAPIKASLSVTSADGSPQVATTLVGERNGWLYLQAKNFEFSSPTIKAKISQESVDEIQTSPIPSSSIAPRVNSPIKKTITCAKGKRLVKVTALKPKCPAGYLRK